ncbi:OmpA family protein [Sulfitobacter algicola]|uniref:OmpA family protein n=1 Tax=Parasulfitobacter algicola TaxID=2614809 RepID=A0ABX2J001_9RHOB|nr:OmpA family protein [Sulfitobacter algicola]
MKKSLLIMGLFALAACESGSGPASLAQETGAQVDQGNFGNATMNNTLVQNGERSATINLTNRFASEVDPSVTFAFNSAALDDAARQTLRQQATWIQQFPEVRFRVYGHTDLVGSDQYNQTLGRRRAEAAVNYLVSQGVDRRRLEALVSFGETRPVVSTQDRERRNRRTVTEVAGFVKNHPALLNGKYAEVIFREYIDPGASYPTELQTIAGSEVQAGQ